MRAPSHALKPGMKQQVPYFIRHYRDFIRRSRFARMLDGHVGN